MIASPCQSNTVEVMRPRGFHARLWSKFRMSNPSWVRACAGPPASIIHHYRAKIGIPELKQQRTCVNFFFQNSFAAPRTFPAARCRWMRVGASSSFAPTITAGKPCYKGSARIGRRVNDRSRRERTVTETAS